MRLVKTFIDDLVVVEPELYKDERGYFFESWNYKKYHEIGIECKFVQDNHSNSHQGVIRGLHFQLKRPQAKLVRVSLGEVLDVAVDLRKESKTFGEHYSILLSEFNAKQLFIPEGFAHGFFALTKNVSFQYKTSDYYHPEFEHTLLWNDPEIGIDWKLGDIIPQISQKDLNGKTLSQIKEIL